MTHSLFQVVAWSLASITVMSLLVEHVHPSESYIDRAKVVWLCGMGHSLMLIGVGSCLDALGA